MKVGVVSIYVHHPLEAYEHYTIHEEYATLKEKGVQFRGEPVKTDYGTQVLFEDGCGNLLQLHQQ